VQARFLSDPSAADDALPGAERDAGALWAKKHKPANPTDCPAYTDPFRQGCAEKLQGARR
jgi:hypothetical protein